jgi:hypothetical protein
MNLRILVFPLLTMLAACGASVFSAVSKSDSDDAVRETALIALDNGNYTKAAASMKKLYDKSNSNKNAQLYAVSLLGLGGFDLFEIMKNALLLAGTSTQGGGSDIMDQMTANSEAIFGGIITSSRQSYAKAAIDVLAAAANPIEAGVHFQKCLAAAIYSIPILQNVAAVKTKLEEIQAANAAAGGAFCSSSSTAQIAAMGSGLTEVIAEAGAVASEISPVSATLDECLGTANKTSTLTSQVKTLLQKADLGCGYSGQPIGGVPLPACINSYVSSTGGDAVAADGKISGCELFINCTGTNNCFAP